jgi:peptidoglycan/LPS O-acetylase OafA/YrhL
MQSLLAITWSLSVEEQFYLVVPTMEKYARRVLPYLLPIAYLLVSLPTFGLFDSVSLPTFFRETTFGPILLGVMLAHALNTPRGFEWVWRLVGWWPSPLIALGLALVAASYPAEEFTGWPRLLAHWAMLALVASCVVRETNILAPLLALWPIRRIGAVSYGIYLYHLLVMHFVIKGFEAAGFVQGHTIFVGTALASWLVAEISYRTFEVRFLKLKAHFVPASQQIAAMRALHPQKCEGNRLPDQGSSLVVREECRSA